MLTHNMKANVRSYLRVIGIYSPRPHRCFSISLRKLFSSMRTKSDLSYLTVPT